MQDRKCGCVYCRRAGVLVLFPGPCEIPYAIEKIASRIEKSVDNQAYGFTRTGKEHIKKLIMTIKHVLILTHRCNLALFYINGIYYHLSKRFTSIQYVLTRKSSVGEHSGNSYRLLGWLCVIQLVGSLLQQLYIMYRRSKEQISSKDGSYKVDGGSTDVLDQSEELESIPNSKKCALCLERRRHATSTPCGHLFCWICIHEWCRSNPKCPFCRDDCQPSRLVFLRNYDV